MKRNNIFSKEEILSKVNALEIYQKATQLKRNGNWIGLCPLHKEKSPSFHVFDDGKFKCFGCKAGGDIISFVMAYYNLNYIGALNWLKSCEFQSVNLVLSDNVVKKQHKETLIEFSDKPFENIHRQYWDKYLLPEEYLRTKNVFAVKAWAINDRLQKMDKDKPVFVYYAEDIDKCKILRIGVDKTLKWKNTVPNSYLWNFPTEPCEDLWVVKSYKDSLCLDYHFGFCTTATQNEDGTILDSNMSRILSICKSPILCFGSDEMAVTNCKMVQQKYKTRYFNTPKRYIKYGIIDTADMIDQFGIEVLRKELIKKKFI